MGQHIGLVIGCRATTLHRRWGSLPSSCLSRQQVRFGQDPNHNLTFLLRATKVSPNLLEAFSSPCLPPLIDLNVKYSKLSELPSHHSKFIHHKYPTLNEISAFQPSLEPRSSSRHTPITSLLTYPTVLSCAIYPGITGSMLLAQINAMPTCKAVILSAFGSGNLPIHEKGGILAALEEAVKKEILVVVTSQCKYA